MRRVVIALAAVATFVVPFAASATHVRPKSASRFNLSMVPAYEPCTAPDRTHGPPLAFPSCSVPDQTSSYLTVGTPDANGFPSKSSAFYLWKISPGVPGPPTDNSIAWRIEITDVRCKATAPGCAAAGDDYAGSIAVKIPSEFTDHNNNANPGGGADPATTQAFDWGFPITCTTTSDPTIGSVCSIVIHYIESFGFAIADGKRTIWATDQIQLMDGGSDADGSTTPDNTKFAVQGLFVP